MARAVLVLSLTLTLALPLRADWPQWRGPNRDGHAPNAQLPAKWPAAPPEPRWVADVGLGYSGAAVARGKLFIHTRNDEKGEERCLCLDALTGKQLWET